MELSTIDSITLLGLIAACLTTAAFVPQTLKTIRTKSTEDLALSTFLMLFIGTFLWLVYGFSINDLPVIAANIITCLLTGVILILKITAMMKKRE